MSRTAPNWPERSTTADLDDVPVRDRPYEHYGQQGLALPTWTDPAVVNELAPYDHEDDDVERGAARIDLGERVARPLPAGPKGWQRRDDRIHDDVCAHLTDDGHVDATNIEVIVHKGEVTLSGTVEDRAQRARAVQLAESVRGVVDVISRLRVAPASDDGAL